MRSILVRSQSADQDEIITELWEHGTLGITEEADGWRAYFEDSADLSPLLNFFSDRVMEARTENPLSPADFPRQDWDPIWVGRRFWIAPSWVAETAPRDRLRLAIDNPNAFGSGRHESTQLALEALEAQALSSLSTVLDVGCGSGILSEAARLLGARSVVSCDIHDDAIESSKAQFSSCIFQGSADAICTHSGDIVFANISAAVIDILAWELSRITKPDGVLILAGFVRDRPPLHFTPDTETQMGDWLCWVCRPQSLSPDARPLATHIHSLQWW